MTAPLLSIILVNYNGAAVLPVFFRSLLDSRFVGAYEVIVVDNGSADGSLSLLDVYREVPIRVIRNATNVGFGVANNQGIEIASAPYLFLVNTDTILQPDTMQRLYDYLQDHPEAGAVSPKLLNSDGSLQIPGSSLGAWRFWGVRPRSVPFLPGTALMMPTDFMRALGGFDPMFFFYTEDVDLCLRIRHKGRQVVFLPSAALVHLGGHSTRAVSIPALVEGYRGGLYFALKHYGVLAFVCYRILLVFVVGIQWLAYGGLSVFSDQAKRSFKAYGRILKMVLSGDLTPIRW